MGFSLLALVAVSCITVDDDFDPAGAAGSAPAGEGGAIAQGDVPDEGSAGEPSNGGAPDTSGAGGAGKADEPITPSGGSRGDSRCGDDGEACLVRGLEIEKISLYQVIEVPLMRGWAEVGLRPAEVVANKPALLRVYVTPQPEWQARMVEAVVELSSSAGQVLLRAQRRISRGSSDAELSSTLNVEIPAELLPGDARFRVSLVEQSVAPRGGDSSRARWPEAALARMGERSPGGPLNVVLVPIRYDADGSGRLPDTSPEQLNLFGSTLAAHYPISRDDIALSVSEPMPWRQSVRADGSGWDELLFGLTDYMEHRGGADDEYYYGVFAPTADGASFCSDACVAGLAFVNQSPGSASRTNAGVGLGYTGRFSAFTMVHELGHLHGRHHAPCGTKGADPEYPYPQGNIGGWGYDVAAGALKSPTQFFDFMGYCPERWVSAYTYDAIFAWMEGTHLEAMEAWSQPRTWRSFRIGSDGQVRLGPSRELASPPGGEEITIEWLAADLALLGSGLGYLTPFGDLPGGVVLAEQPAYAPAFARIDGSAPVAL